ncbi:hypothetical protein PIB30_039035 [Stylosanthes scabra]|uniref:Uncharacterized protein n=1 Tax=Stylosanthes scabra TaxID=79078 RepID=A0ABU6REX6_9FABA|nr:hypothetical protein [Stylosanthes scabra]
MKHVDEGRRWGHMTTNLSECINSMLKGTRRLPVAAIIRATYEWLQQLFSREDLNNMRVTHCDRQASVFSVEDATDLGLWNSDKTSQVHLIKDSEALEKAWRQQNARNGAPAPCPSRARALDVDFVIKKRVARPRHLGPVAARSTQIFIWTIIYFCKALDVRFPMALEPSHLDLGSSSYGQISDRRSGLTALGDFLRTDLRMRIRHRIA